jgi:hypothetical protein
VEKRCPKCGLVLPADQFGKDRHGKFGLSNRCKPCNRDYEAERRAANPEAHRAKVRRWAAKNANKIAAYTEGYRDRRREIDRVWQTENRDKVREKSRRWRERNREKVAAYNAKYREERADFVSQAKRDWARRNPEAVAAHGARRRANPKYRIEATIRARIHATLTRGSKSAGTFELLGYSSDELRAHLERQFKRGMSWGNYGEWHIDHVVPLSSFSYETPDDPDFRRAWALTNLAPMWGKENMEKGAKRLTLL